LQDADDLAREVAPPSAEHRLGGLAIGDVRAEETDANYLVASVHRLLHHVAPEFPRGPDDADFHGASPSGQLLERSRTCVYCHVILIL
jgi:hypothetical protein